MISELLKHSDNKELLENVPEHLRDVHKTRKRVRIEEQGVMLPPPKRNTMPTSLWADDADDELGYFGAVGGLGGASDDDLDGVDLE
jgi:hypothetical protein